VYRQLHNTSDNPPKFYYRTDTNRRQYLKGFRAKLATKAVRDSGEEVYDGLQAGAHPLDSSFEAEVSDGEEVAVVSVPKRKSKKNEV
jgi:hypothetical protein